MTPGALAVVAAGEVVEFEAEGGAAAGSEGEPPAVPGVGSVAEREEAVELVPVTDPQRFPPVATDPTLAATGRALAIDRVLEIGRELVTDQESATGRALAIDRVSVSDRVLEIGRELEIDQESATGRALAIDRVSVSDPALEIGQESEIGRALAIDRVSVNDPALEIGRE